MAKRSKKTALRLAIGIMAAMLGLIASRGTADDSKSPEAKNDARDPWAVLQRTGAPPPDQLLDLFDQSDLVLTAIAGPSEILDRKDIVETELLVESVLKGGVSERSVTLHSNAPEAIAERRRSFGSIHDVPFDPEKLVAGTKVLAFLLLRKDAAGRSGEPIYKSADHRIQILDDPERAAFAKRLGALAELDRNAGGIGKVSPSDLMEWLVATEEEPLTRGEAAEMIADAHDRLRDLAERKGTTQEIALQDLRATLDRGKGGTLGEDDRLALLGAALTDGQKKRFAAALRTGKGFKRGDVWLFTFAWIWNDLDTALSSLAYRLRTAELDPEEETWIIQPLRSIARYTDDQAPFSLIVEEFTRGQIFHHLWPNDTSDEGQRLRVETMAPLYKELRYRIAEALESRERTLATEREAPQGTATIAPPPDVDQFRTKGALLSEAQKKRLGEALRTAEDLKDYGAVVLYDLVRGWDPEGARNWLLNQLRTVAVSTFEIDDLIEAADALGNKEWSALAKAADDRAEEIEALWPDDKSAETAKIRQKMLVELTTKLRLKFVEGLLILR